MSLANASKGEKLLQNLRLLPLLSTLGFSHSLLKQLTLLHYLVPDKSDQNTRRKVQLNQEAFQHSGSGLHQEVLFDFTQKFGVFMTGVHCRIQL